MNGKTVARIAKKTVNRMAETKEVIYYNTAVGGGATSFYSIGYGSSSSVATLCAGIAQGTAGNQRIGRRIYLRGMKVWFPFVAGDASNYVRFIVASPKGGNVNSGSAVSSVISDLLSGAGSSGTQYLSPVDTDKWQVHFDRCMWLHKVPLDGSSTTTTEPVKWVRKWIRINRKVEYLDNTNANCVRDVWMFGISDSGGITHPGAASGFVKMYFKDV